MAMEFHDDVTNWKHLPCYWPFVWGIHRSPVNSPHKGQWRGALMFSLIYAWINGCVNNREAGDLRRHRGHYDVTVMSWESLPQNQPICENFTVQVNLAAQRCRRIKKPSCCSRSRLWWVYMSILVPDQGYLNFFGTRSHFKRQWPIHKSCSLTVLASLNWQVFTFNTLYTAFLRDVAFQSCE